MTAAAGQVGASGAGTSGAGTSGAGTSGAGTSGAGTAGVGTLGGVDPEVLRARAYLSRVAEVPAPALATWVRALGPVAAAEAVRDARVPEAVRVETAARYETDRADDDLALLASRGGRLLVPESPDWPWAAFDGFGRPDEAVDGRLAPLALWVRGPAAPIRPDRPTVAVVGARAATDYGLWVARDWAAGLADRGIRVVSGAALGVDGAAHRGALAAGGVTIAVLAGGIDRPYPPRNAALIEHIANTGLVVSEYPPGTVPARHRFLVRNRLVAAFGTGTVVVEAGARSGARSTAGAALALGRPVMVVPGPVSSAMSLGCHQLARQEGVTVVGRVEDVAEDVGRLGDDLAPRPWTPARPTDRLRPEAWRVREALSSRVAQSEARLAHDSGVAPERITTHLSDLVAAGLAEEDESGCWRRPG